MTEIDWKQRDRLRKDSLYRERRLLAGVKARAKKFGLACDLVLADITIPLLCPVLGIPLKDVEEYRDGIPALDGAARNHSPSIDRVDNRKGYVKGNIRIISWRANRLKSDATVDEARRIYEYLKANMRGDGPATIDELRSAANLHPRMVQEWQNVP